MAQNGHAFLNATAIITKRKSVKLIGVTVAVIGAAGSKLEIYNNNDGTGTPIYTVDGTVSGNHTNLDLNCDKGLYGKITTGGQYNVIYN